MSMSPSPSMQITVSVSTLLLLQGDWTAGRPSGASVSLVQEVAFRVQSIVSLPTGGLGDLSCVALTEELTVTQWLSSASILPLGSRFLCLVVSLKASDWVQIQVNFIGACPCPWRWPWPCAAVDCDCRPCRPCPSVLVLFVAV